MPRYAVNIAISAARLPDPEPLPPGPGYDPGKDPIVGLTQTFQDMTKSFRAPVFLPERPDGMTLGKTVQIDCANVEELGKILCRFDAVADEVSCAHPTPE